MDIKLTTSHTSFVSIIFTLLTFNLAFNVLTPLVGCQEEHPACKQLSDEMRMVDCDGGKQSANVLVVAAYRAVHYVLQLRLFFSLPILSGHRLDVYHTSTQNHLSLLFYIIDF